MQIFVVMNRIVFFISLMLVSGAEIFRVFLAAPLKNPGTEPKIQNFLLRLYKSANLFSYMFWILLLGTGISEIMLGEFSGTSILWLVLAGIFYSMVICFDLLSYSIIRKNEFNLMATPEMERRRFGYYVYYGAISTVLMIVSVSILTILI